MVAGYFVFVIVLVLAITSTYAFDFQDGNNGQVKWSSGCDFDGKDIGGGIPGPGEDCGTNCLNNPSCTHFTWFNNNCYIKNFGSSAPTAVALDGAVCGWKAGSSPGTTPGPGPGPGSGVQVSFKNNCPHTIWLANTGTPSLQSVTLNQGQSHTYNIDKNTGWNGRIWPKYGCDNSGNNCLFGNSVAPCPSGGCQPPADTKVEFNIPSQPPSRDSWYDVSLVDGYSLPMKIVPRGVNQGSCIPATCTMSLDNCPSNENNGLGDLRVWKNNQVVACLAPCKKWYDIFKTYLNSNICT